MSAAEKVRIDIESERGQALDALRRAADDIAMLRRRIEELGFYERAFLVVERALMGEPVRGGMMHPDPLWAARQAIELLEKGGAKPLDAASPIPSRLGDPTAEMVQAGSFEIERQVGGRVFDQVGPAQGVWRPMVEAAPVDHEFDEVEPGRPSTA